MMRGRNRRFAFMSGLVAMLLLCAHRDMRAQWVPTSKPIDMSIKALASNSTTLFVGGVCFDEATQKQVGCVFRSPNKGKDWEQTSLKGDLLHALAASGQVVFAGCYDGVYRSPDNGQTWTKVNKGLTQLAVWSLAISGQNVLAGTENTGVFLSDLSGQNWKSSTLKSARVDSMAVNGTSVLAGTEGDGIWMSTDGGEVWQDITKGIPDSYVLAVGFKGTTIFGASMEHGIYLSTTNGKTWTNVNDTQGLRAIVIVSGSVFASGNGGGPLSSDDGGQSWGVINKGLAPKALVEVWSLAGQGADVFAGGGDEVVYRIADVSPIKKLMGGPAKVGPKLGPLKPNGPVNKTPISSKPPPTLASAKSDLAAGVSVYVSSKSGMVVMDAFVTNYGPNAISYGMRTVTFSARNKGTTYTFFKDEKIPALKGTATTPSQQAGSSFTLSHSVPISWDFDDNTTYEVKISPSITDPNPKNDVANQVGPNKGKP